MSYCDLILGYVVSVCSKLALIVPTMQLLRVQTVYRQLQDFI